MSPLFSKEDISSLQRKVPYLILCVFIFILISLGRLYYLQIQKGDKYLKQSHEISLREEEVRAKRGQILDRNGRVLASNRHYFQIGIIPQYLKKPDKTFSSLAKLLEIKKEDLINKYEESPKRIPFEAVVLIEDATYDDVARIKQYQKASFNEDDLYFLEAVSVKEAYLRHYLYPELFSHVLGYVKEVDQKSLSQLKSKYPQVYSLGDIIGASGLEKSYDLQLKGEDGYFSRVVDARGKEIHSEGDLELLRQSGDKLSKNGFDLHTSLDFKAQEAAAKAFEGRRGAVVAMNPQDGSIVAIYSSPPYNPNRIVGKIDKKYWQKINLHEDKFLYNRTVQGAYPPGSTYKMVTALAGLDQGFITKETTYNCGGGMRYGRRFFHCWNKGGHGPVDLNKAIRQSCDVYFYKVGDDLKVDGIHQMATRFGLGSKTGIDLPFEVSGLIPSEAWKQKRYKQDWIASETLSVSIGQSYNLLTPVQSAMMVSILANGGYAVQPHLKQYFLDEDGNKIQQASFDKGEKLLNEDHLKLIQEGMIEVVHGAGTARRLRKSPNKIAGKTGTSQVIGYQSKAKKSERTKDHALFVAYAPYDNPQIAVSVIVENGGHGGATAAPVAMEVIDAYLGQGETIKN